MPRRVQETEWSESLGDEKKVVFTKCQPKGTGSGKSRTNRDKDAEICISKDMWGFNVFC
jgi:hypothetical protein